MAFKAPSCSSLILVKHNSSFEIWNFWDRAAEIFPFALKKISELSPQNAHRLSNHFLDAARCKVWRGIASGRACRPANRQSRHYLYHRKTTYLSAISADQRFFRLTKLHDDTISMKPSCSAWFVPTLFPPPFHRNRWWSCFLLAHCISENCSNFLEASHPHISSFIKLTYSLDVSLYSPYPCRHFCSSSNWTESQIDSTASEPRIDCLYIILQWGGWADHRLLF